jgi:hypothetical protein
MSNKFKEVKNLNGIISPSMAVDTRPAHKLDVAGYWILVDPNMPKPMFEKMKMAIMIHDVEFIKDGNNEQ